MISQIFTLLFSVISFSITGSFIAGGLILLANRVFGKRVKSDSKKVSIPLLPA